MENCIERKYKDEVQNNNLPYFHSIIIKAFVNGDSWVRVSTNSAETHIVAEVLTPNVKVKKNGGHGTIIADNIIEVWGESGQFGFMVTDNNGNNIPNTYVQIKVTNKYNLSSFIGAPVNMKFIENMTALNYIRIRTDTSIDIDSCYIKNLTNLQYILFDDQKCSKKINLSDFEDMNLVQISINSSNQGENYIEGDFSSLSEATNLAYLSLSSRNQRFTGDISVFKNNTMRYFAFDGNAHLTGNIQNLPILENNSTVSLGRSTGISGSLESYVERMRTIGNTIGSNIALYEIRGTNVTFNGSIITGDGKKLSWDANTITFA